ncbi:LysR family transcriptional regulator [Paenibacillus lactis]|uniref:Transcriptional regulator, LysR family n=2 Tax=Paenibacillus lactis TaxID=228574 RepID=G4HD93_9BACL|nr:LysR family transcriptional regulator [Paenibacillus lactis]EHB66019.1 transcriptional regulator, LysR family [Paenibacillus lactis 154]MBP1891405.1 DNA-binding transcriptional LysR family regulator [Paenibacillus lactis]MCM3493831.1 LysR family transcriptional regulator [Paenibacillus lactis]HAF98224.1 LysR family transcriptional regulator [Paenibacillus lactis]
MLEKLEGRFLVTFLTVVGEGSFSRAADKLGYVQSTVTSQIQMLEQICGNKLFHRLSRGVKPTDAGEKLAVYARQFVQLGQMLEEDLGSLERPRGPVRVRALESFCVTRLSGFLNPFFAEYPEVTLLLETGFQGDIVDQVASHEIDFGIVPKDPEREDILFEPLVEENLVLVCSNELASRIRSEDWSGLTGVQVIGFGSRCVYHNDGLRILAELGLPASAPQAEFPSTEMIRSMVACGLGIAFVPEITMEKELATGTVVSIPLPKPVRMNHGLIWHRDRVLGTPAKVFREKLLEYITSPPNKTLELSDRDPV